MSGDVPPPVAPRRQRGSTAQQQQYSDGGPVSPDPQLPSLGMSSQSSAPKLEDTNAFGYSLQSSYEAISKRHDEELHALESMRMHVFKRMKCDKDYADQLHRTNTSCQRLGQFTTNTTSAAVQVRDLCPHYSP